MRKLDAINPQFAKPCKIGAYAFFIPFVIGFGTWALAVGAGHDIEFTNNYLAMFGVGMSVLSILGAPIPFLFKWNWKAKYFGFSVFCLGSFAGAGIIPLLCIIIYGTWPLWASVGLLLANGGLIVWWCRRFILLYRHIYADKELWKRIYVEEDDAVYYQQQGDKWVTDKKLKFSQFPSNLSMIVAVGVAFFLTLLMSWVTHFVGVPFPHIFLTVGAIPINLMCLGLATRGYLIFYYYPWKIKRETGKDVYVDMVTK